MALTMYSNVVTRAYYIITVVSIQLNCIINHEVGIFIYELGVDDRTEAFYS
ncbi:MAG: hypothetical protein ACXAC7_04200 [Candidatus Hodarchaeales archaeon]